MSRTFNLDENIFEMEYYTGETLELNKGNWGNDKSEYDFRLWLDDLPSSGFSLSKDDLYLLYLGLEDYFDEKDLEYNYAYKDFDDVLLVNEEKVSIMLQGLTETEDGIEIHLLYANGTDDDWRLNVTYITVDNRELSDDDGPTVIEVTYMEADSGIKKASFELEGLSLMDEHIIEFVFWISDEPYELFTSSTIRILNDAENEELIVELEDDEEEIEDSDDETEETEEEILEFKSFLVYTDNSKCQLMGHDTSSIEALVDVCLHSGEVKRFRFPAVWCEDCNAYYISESIFRQLQSQGTILCRVFSQDKFINRNTMFDGFNQQSILYSYGYNVNAKDNKSDLERRAVLDRVIEHGIMSKDEIIDFLLYLIDRPTGNRNMSQSIRKWRSDIEYLSGKKTQIKAGSINLDNIDWDYIMSNIKKDMPF